MGKPHKFEMGSFPLRVSPIVALNTGRFPSLIRTPKMSNESSVVSLAKPGKQAPTVYVPTSFEMGWNR